MTASEILAQATAEGLTLALVDDQISAQGPRNLLARWAPELRDHKAELLAYLAANDSAPILAPEVEVHRLWLIHHPDTGWVSHSFTPPCTEAEVRDIYPFAIILPDDDDSHEV